MAYFACFSKIFDSASVKAAREINNKKKLDKIVHINGLLYTYSSIISFTEVVVSYHCKI